MPVSLMFQSTRPHGARRARTSRAAVHSMFQSTRPHGARRLRGCRPCRPGRFNPRARTGRDPFLPRGPAISRQFQSTRPHGARRLDQRPATAFLVVSIHAPARGATCGAGATWNPSYGFNPRARTGRDPRSWAAKSVFPCFNPRARTGRDSPGPAPRACCGCFNPRARTGRDAANGPVFHLTSVSIHAPARGATHAFPEDINIGWFQSTRPHGARPGGMPMTRQPLWFQSTRPHGARLLRQWPRWGRAGFNPRARTGRDPISRSRWSHRTCFNPRARTGRDLSRPLCSCVATGFQSTRPHGARPKPLNGSAGQFQFQSTRALVARLS